MYVSLETCHRLRLSLSSRKNPIHFQEFSHPSDADYEQEDAETDEADRPECPYGTDCYRSVCDRWGGDGGIVEAGFTLCSSEDDVNLSLFPSQEKPSSQEGVQTHEEARWVVLTFCDCRFCEWAQGPLRYVAGCSSRCSV